MTIWKSAYAGSLAADALAMPVHWYYDRKALLRDYGVVDRFLEPKSPHPDSILWRSRYDLAGGPFDFLGEQARYWGRRGVHYHQFLKAGENTLNFQLARELHNFVTEAGGYDADAWLERLISLMLRPGWNRDTYAEEWLRHFFKQLAHGKPPRQCAAADEHIGGLATVPALLAALPDRPADVLRETVREHVALTHDHPGVLRAADTLTRLLGAVAGGLSLTEALETEAADWLPPEKARRWLAEADDYVIGQRLSPACYIAESMPAALYLSWKYAGDFAGGITANAMVGGDSCHRGAVVGALLGAANGVPPRFAVVETPA